jgi:uncharacterized protein YbjT (DUF2867 family)
MNVFLSGATGNIGYEILKRLVNENQQCRPGRFYSKTNLSG